MPEPRPPAGRAGPRMRAAHGAGSQGLPRMRMRGVREVDPVGGKRAVRQPWRRLVLRRVVAIGFRLWRSG